MHPPSPHRPSIRTGQQGRTEVTIDLLAKDLFQALTDALALVDWATNHQILTLEVGSRSGRSPAAGPAAQLMTLH